MPAPNHLVFDDKWVRSLRYPHRQGNAQTVIATGKWADGSSLTGSDATVIATYLKPVGDNRRSKVLRQSSVLLAVLFAGSAQAQETLAQVQVACAPHPYMMAKAISSWHEGAVLQSPASHSNQFMELLLSRTGTWTIIVTRADDMSCIMAEGEGLMLSGEIPLLGEGM